ncbi:MAG: DUF1775 domain-containing protein [Methylococcaceae bacterium]
MLKKQLKNLSVICVLAATSSVAMAHLNIAKENAMSIGEGSREYKEGSSAFLNVNISHDCTNEEGKHFATSGIELLLPNGESVMGGITKSHGGDVYGANAVMGIKQRMNHTFRSVRVKKGAVSPYYSHGEKTEDVRLLSWMKGNVDNDHYDNLEFKTSFPKIDEASCVAKIKMYFPSVQYCRKGYKIAWIGTPDSVWGEGDAKTRVTDRYAASLSVVRTTELPAECVEGETVEAKPSVDEINKYLGRHFGHNH